MKSEKILIEMKHGLGDCVCMLPAIAAVRYNHPNAYIAIVVNGSANEEIFKHSHIPIDKFYYFSLKNKSKWHTIKTLFALFREHFQYGVLATMTPKEKGRWLFRILRIANCYGEQYKNLNFLDLDNRLHFVKRNLDVVKDFCPKVINDQPHLYAEEREGKPFQDLLKSPKPKIAVSIGGADKNYYKGDYVFTRAWGKEKMKKLVSLLSESEEYDICLIGGALEKELLADYKEILKKENIYNFVAKTSIGETIYLLSQCILAVGVDTGMQHVADALGVATVSIFGPTNPYTHGAYSNKATFVQCSPKSSCQYCFGTDMYYTCPKRTCLDQISVKQVYDTIISKLSQIH